MVEEGHADGLEGRSIYLWRCVIKNPIKANKVMPAKVGIVLLRAGLGIGGVKAYSAAKWVYRVIRSGNLEPVEYYCKVPTDLAGEWVIDPMLA